MENTVTSQPNTTEGMCKAVYLLYLVGLFTGITALIGLIIAYINRNDAPDWLQTHYQFQIRTFWIGFLFLILGTLLSYILIGIFILLFWIIWLIVRVIKGWKYLSQQKPHPNPSGWML
ncbi:hypothetical protein QC823_15105 [Halomonas vilamensis]|uniref:Transmembrane protein n=1 Tax=Vreelandella vilamensis TaxID=531309 RepID=A0ABU1H9W5_9GAMM|nr:hypothetical protein [Halomonas vilamensis]MDR5900298.1 hypothetical protein [Halomonas vilamensis]